MSNLASKHASSEIPKRSFQYIAHINGIPILGCGDFRQTFISIKFYILTHFFHLLKYATIGPALDQTRELCQFAINLADPITNYTREMALQCYDINPTGLRFNNISRVEITANANRLTWGTMEIMQVFRIFEDNSEDSALIWRETEPFSLLGESYTSQPSYDFDFLRYCKIYF